MFRQTTKLEDFNSLKQRLQISDENKASKKAKCELDLTNVLDNKIELAYKEACENRRFEIQMYWHRAGYFWAFIVSIYTAFFFVSGNDGSAIVYKEMIKLALSFLGFVFCLGFYFSNKGSKVWQENWEIHEGFLEDEVAVKLYKTFYYDENKNYSVSKINDVLCAMLSFFSFAFFIAVLVFSIQHWFEDFPFIIKAFLFVFAIFVVLIFLHIVKKQVSGNPFETKELKFKQAEYHE